jgi:hypothetical protein
MPVVKAAMWVWLDGECTYLKARCISHLANDLAKLLKPSFCLEKTDSFLYWPDDYPDVHFVIDTLEVDSKQVLHEALLDNKPRNKSLNNLLASTQPPHVLSIAVTLSGVNVRYAFLPRLLRR